MHRARGHEMPDPGAKKRGMRGRHDGRFPQGQGIHWPEALKSEKKTYIFRANDLTRVLYID